MEDVRVHTLSEIEAAVHKQFDQGTKPLDSEVVDFLNKKYPRMDVTVIIIALAGLIIKAWDTYRNEQERQIAARRISGNGQCPVCDDTWKDAAGKRTCKHGFTW